MVFVSGDLHGDRQRFFEPGFRKLRKNDCLLICGDFGFVWDGSPAERKVLNSLSKFKYKIMFVEGTHENFELLNAFPSEDFCGGKVRALSKNVYQMLRGEIYQIEGKKFFAFGGGHTLDSEAADNTGRGAGQESELTQAGISRARENLERAGWTVDYIISHDITSRIRGFLDVQDEGFTLVENFLDEVSKKCSFKRWFFGCYHIDKVISPLYTAVFKNVIPLDK
ncbi:MAG: hypothetical protein LBC56_05340 [Oscillospiraceae bacterium]|nr:hypothetical protein [Oscillospiraceae bacterium]